MDASIIVSHYTSEYHNRYVSSSSKSENILKCEYSDIRLVFVLAFCTEPGVTYFVV